MGPMRALREGLSLAALACLITGCAAPLSPSPGDRAVAIYRDGSYRPAGGSAPGGEAPGLVGGHHGTATPGSLTADEAVALAKANSTGLAAKAALVEAAKAKVAAAGQPANPEIRVSQLRLDQLLADQGQERTALRVFVPRPGELEAKVAIARAEEAEARAALHAEEVTLEADVRWAFDDVVLLEGQIAAAEAVAASRKAIAERLAARLASATTTALDEAMAAMSAVAAEQDRAELSAERASAKAALLALIGLAPGAEVRIMGEPLSAWPPPKLPDEKALIEAALRARPEIAIAASRLDAGDARAALERAKRWPWFSFLELGYEVGAGIPGGLGWTFQAGVEVPILDTHRNGVAAADAAQTAAHKALDAEVERIAREVGARLRDARAAETLVTEMRARSLPTTERAAAAVQRALAGNDVDAVQALTVDERRVLLEARLLAAIRRYRVAVSELRRAVGGKLP